MKAIFIMAIKAPFVLYKALRKEQPSSEELIKGIKACQSLTELERMQDGIFAHLHRENNLAEYNKMLTAFENKYKRLNAGLNNLN